MAAKTATQELLIDRFLPEYDVTTVHHTIVDAPPEDTYAAIARTDLSKDPLSSFLGRVRDLPNLVERKLKGIPEEPHGPVTFDSLEQAGWAKLAEEQGVELVAGVVARPWQRDYGFERVAPEEFAAFAEPDYAKIAVSLSVRPYGAARTLLTYEARTATTDSAARRRFRRYWTIIGPGAAILMRGALRLIKAEAERSPSAGAGAST